MNVDVATGKSRPGASFAEADCKVFARYPVRINWSEETVSADDQEVFRSVRFRLDNLAKWVARNATTKVELEAFVSTLNPNGRTPRDLWCCVYPKNSPNKSYALQVALIISADGAELCLCLGSGTSQLKQTDLRRDGEQYLQTLQSRLRSAPHALAEDVADALPKEARFLSAWRQPPGVREFRDIREWLRYASNPEGTEASVSRFFSIAELETLGDGIADAYLNMLEAAAPLFDYCFADGVTDGGEELDPSPPLAMFDLATLRGRASAPPYGLQLGDEVYRAVIASVLSGKHLILTGPPGTAKTTLAEIVCQLAVDAGLSRGYTLTTATADWTTYETIGGLRPANNGMQLQFRPGLCLEAAAAKRWLIIDELNRSNFDRAFGQLFTLLSGQSVVLPYEDHVSGKRIVLAVAGSATRYRRDGYSVIDVPPDWRIIATMNVFDKTLLFEMSYALMRRFAFVEVPAPGAEVLEEIWQRELNGLSDEMAKRVGKILAGLEPLRAIKQLGPAVFKDMALFAPHYLRMGYVGSDGALAFQLFYSFLLPQFEGIDERDGRRLFRTLSPLVGAGQQDRLKASLRDVLGVTVDADDDAPDGA
ncbi:AAA family ATPase [Asanoa sp. NPDC049573]|uniref:AAA family ATPase n=1 Tax=Asanoa sp. NPDC049573 TaxID=3155396 RepID=UPI003442E697